MVLGVYAREDPSRRKKIRQMSPPIWGLIVVGWGRLSNNNEGLRSGCQQDFAEVLVFMQVGVGLGGQFHGESPVDQGMKSPVSHQI